MLTIVLILTVCVFVKIHSFQLPAQRRNFFAIRETIYSKKADVDYLDDNFDAPLERRMAVGDIVRSGEGMALDHDIVVETKDDCYLDEDGNCVDFDPIHNPRSSSVIVDAEEKKSSVIQDAVNFVGETLSEAFSPFDHEPVASNLKDMPSFQASKSWSKYKKHNWATDDQAKRFAAKFIASEPEKGKFDYWIVKEGNSNRLRLYNSDPDDVANPAKYIAFGVSQGLAPIDRDPPKTSREALKPFKTVKLSDLKEALKDDPYFFDH